MSSECTECGEHALECKCAKLIFKRIQPFAISETFDNAIQEMKCAEKFDNDTSIEEIFDWMGSHISLEVENGNP